MGFWDSGLLRREAIRNDSIKIDEDAVVDGIWGRDEKIISDYGTESAENSQFEKVDNFDESGTIKENKIVLTLDNLTKAILKTKPSHSPKPDRWISSWGSITIDNGVDKRDFLLKTRCMPCLFLNIDFFILILKRFLNKKDRAWHLPFLFCEFGINGLRRRSVFLQR